MQRFAWGVLLLAWSAPLLAAAPAPTAAVAKTPEPATALEKFTARHGRLLIKTFKPLGKLEGQFDSSVNLEILMLASPGATDTEKVYGIRFERPAVERYEADELSFLDYDECSSLQQALAYMQKLVAQSASGTDETEVDYVTRGGMKVGFCQSASGERTGFLQVGGSIGGKDVFFPVSKLAELSQLLDRGTATLKELGAK